jgi:hypothetical protein
MADQTAFKVSNLVIVYRGWGITESGQVVSVTRCFLQIIFNASVLCNGRVLALVRKENVVLIVDGASNTGDSEPLVPNVISNVISDAEDDTLVV